MAFPEEARQRWRLNALTDRIDAYQREAQVETRRYLIVLFSALFGVMLLGRAHGFGRIPRVGGLSLLVSAALGAYWLFSTALGRKSDYDIEDVVNCDLEKLASVNVKLQERRALRDRWWKVVLLLWLAGYLVVFAGYLIQGAPRP